MSQDPFIHPSAYIDEPCQIGPRTKIWHFCHIMPHAHIGADCNLGQNVFIGAGVTLGQGVKIQNNVSVYAGVTLEDYVFCGPSCVFTNVMNPRSEINRKEEYAPTRIRRGASLGANCTIVCGITVGRYAFIGAGAVVRKTVPDYALIVGVPGVQKGWMSRHGVRLPAPDAAGVRRCPLSGWLYQETDPGHLVCLDWDADAPLPA